MVRGSGGKPAALEQEVERCSESDLACVIAAACATASLVAVSLASAESGPVKLKGTQTVVNEAKGLYTMKGSLIGSWKTIGVQGQLLGAGR